MDGGDAMVAPTGEEQPGLPGAGNMSAHGPETKHFRPQSKSIGCSLTAPLSSTLTQDQRKEEAGTVYTDDPRLIAGSLVQGLAGLTPWFFHCPGAPGMLEGF